MRAPTEPEPLAPLLKRADPGSAFIATMPPAAFVAAVHARLRAPAPVPSLWQRFLARQALPLAASLTVLASFATGGSIAYTREHRARTQAYASAYARSIDPWQIHGAVAKAATPVPTASEHHHP